MAENNQPLLSFKDEDQTIANYHHQQQPDVLTPTPDTNDIPPVETTRDFFREFYTETKKLWYLAGPAIFTSLCQYSLGAITQVFAGHVSTLALAAVSVENSVIAGFSFGIMVLKFTLKYQLCVFFFLNNY